MAVGDSAWVAGTTASSAGSTPPENATGQARVAFEIAIDSLSEIGFTVRDVVRTRMYVTNIGDAEAVGMVHAEIFAEVSPTATMLAVSALMDPALLVEVELEARRTATQ